jgi:hypothetical protein
MDGKAEEVAQGVVALVTTMASGVPVLGALAQQGVAKAFAASSQGALRREYEALEREEDRKQFAEQVADPIAELIGQALIQILRVQHRDSEDVVRQLGGLREDLEGFRKEFATRLTEAAVVVDELEVVDYAVGIRVGPSTRKQAKVGKMTVGGRGTGIVLE